MSTGKTAMRAGLQMYASEIETILNAEPELRQERLFKRFCSLEAAERESFALMLIFELDMVRRRTDMARRIKETA